MMYNIGYTEHPGHASATKQTNFLSLNELETSSNNWSVARQLEEVSTGNVALNTLETWGVYHLILVMPTIIKGWEWRIQFHIKPFQDR